VKQILSDGTVLKDFKVGDIPYSAACDYMSDCEYKCYPDKDIDDSNTKEDTYNEVFIMMNSEKIVQKIRKLFGNKIDGKFFFKKADLIRQINIPKPYPLVQIYAALTQLIEDASEIIMDKYGRAGRLINIGEYYLFQPIELRDKNISIFDRSVPLDYKHNMINFELKQNIEDIDPTFYLQPSEKLFKLFPTEKKIAKKATDMYRLFQTYMNTISQYGRSQTLIFQSFRAYENSISNT
jgi:hypothetical protein